MDKKLEDLFYYNTYDGCKTIDIKCFIKQPKKIKNKEDVLRYEKWANQGIKEFKKYIELLELYRIELYERYKELETTVFKTKLSLIRSKSYYDKKVYYTVHLYEYSNEKDVDNKTIKKETFSGAERKKAFELFEQLKRTYNGIETEIDINKKEWEK